MVTVPEVDSFIKSNVLHSKLWDTATDVEKQKAVNQAQRMLKSYLSRVYKSNIPIEDIVEQVLWLFKLDDTMQRADVGTSSITVDGISIQLKEMDRTISPRILLLYGLSTTRQKRVGSYKLGVNDTHRMGNRRR